MTTWLECLMRGCQREAVWTYGWLWSERQESEAIGGLLCQGRSEVCRAFNYMTEESQDRAALGWRAAIECLLQRT